MPISLRGGVLWSSTAWTLNVELQALLFLNTQVVLHLLRLELYVTGILTLRSHSLLSLTDEDSVGLWWSGMFP